MSNEALPQSEAMTLVVGSFHELKLGKGIEFRCRDVDQKTFPENVTLGFRGTFWRIFSDLTRGFEGQIHISWLGADWTVASAWVVRSEERSLELHLDDPRHVLVVIALHSASGKDGRWINRAAFEQGVNEQDLLKSLYRLLSPHPELAFLSSARHARDLPARFLMSVDAGEVPTTSMVALACFFLFAQLICWQVDRDHAAIQLDPDPRDLNAKLRAILRNRARIINLRRFFLTQNITNHQPHRDIARRASDHVGIERKVRGFVEANDLLERFYLTSSQIRQNRSVRVLNLTALLIAAIGLPTAIMSMLLAFQKDTLIVKEPDTFLREVEYLTFVAASAAASLLVMTVIYVLARIVIGRGS